MHYFFPSVGSSPVIASVNRIDSSAGERLKNGEASDENNAEDAKDENTLRFAAISGDGMDKLRTFPTLYGFGETTGIRRSFHTSTLLAKNITTVARSSNSLISPPHGLRLYPCPPLASPRLRLLSHVPTFARALLLNVGFKRY